MNGDAKEEDWKYEPRLEQGTKELKSKVEKTRELDAGRAKAKVKERKLKQADTDIAFDTMRLYQIPKKKAIETGFVAKEDPVVGGSEFDPSAERHFQTTVPVREKKVAREGTWSQELVSKENLDLRKEKEESRKEKMESGAMDDLKQIEEAHSEAGVQERGKKSHKNKALEVFNAAEVKKKGEMSLQLPSKEKQSDAGGRSFQDQGGSHTAAVSMRVQAILEESDVLKDLEELAGDGSDVVEGGQAQVDKTEEGGRLVDKTSPEEKVNGLLDENEHSEKVTKFLEVVGVKKKESVEEKQTGSHPRQKQKEKRAAAANETKELEESRPISVPSSPEAEEALREDQGEVLTLDDSPEPNHPARSSTEKSSSAT